ncbi:hypothetical protein LINGRAHAP2_LOCUS5762, partial [Linum grandiflorum]
MELFIMAYNPALWVILKDGPREVKTNYDKWTDEDIKKCGRLDHLKVDCPRLRRENERALQAVWGGSEDDDDSSDGEVIAAQAHMAIAETIKNTTEVCYLAANQENEWILDSGCTHHMTGNKSFFNKINITGKGNVKFGDNRKSKILGVGEILSEKGVILKKVYLVENLKHNLLSISQICSGENYVVFDSNKCYV